MTVEREDEINHLKKIISKVFIKLNWLRCGFKGELDQYFHKLCEHKMWCYWKIVPFKIDFPFFKILNLC